MIPDRFVALAERWPTEAAARYALEADLAPGHQLGRYRGVWLTPTGTHWVHLFTDADPDWLRDAGWIEAT